MGKPLISVVIPAYNASDFLEQCLDSLCMQTLDDFEVIIVDDGSTDSTASIADSFQHVDERFRLVRTENGGVSKARNRGIEISEGKYITFVDADDALHPEALASMYGALRDHEASVCVTSYASFKKDWRKYGVRVPRRKGNPEVYTYTQAMKVALYQKRLLNSPWGMMMERRLLGADRRFREGIRYEDLDAFYRFYEGAERIVYIPYPYYFYRENPNGFIHQWSDARLDVLDVTTRISAYFERNYPELKKAASDRLFSAHYNMLLLMLKNGVNNTEAIEKCNKVIKEGRWQALIDPNVRLKNKIGALLSYGGLPILKILSKLYSGQ